MSTLADIDILNNLTETLKTLLDDTERRDYEPPVPSLAVANLELLIAEFRARTAHLADVVLSNLGSDFVIKSVDIQQEPKPGAKIAWIRWWRNVTGDSLYGSNENWHERCKHATFHDFSRYARLV